MEYVIPIVMTFAGMLVGYFFWYQDHSDEEAQRKSLARENEDLRASLKLAHNSHEKLDERFLRQKGQLNVLQQLCDDWSSSRDQAERDRANLEAEVSDKARRLEESLSELQNEKQKRISLEDQTHQLNQQQIEKLGELEREWRKRNATIESSLFQRQADLKSTSSENTRLAKQLHSSEARIAELQSELNSQRSLLETATKNASGLEQEYVTVESALEESSALLKQSKSECASALSAQKVAEESLVEMDKGQSALQSEMETLQNKLSEMESLQAENASLLESLKNGAKQLDKVTIQRNKALASEKSVMASAKGLQQRIENQEATIHKLRDKHDAVLQQMKAELQRRSKVESELDRLTAMSENRIKEQSELLEKREATLTNELSQTKTKLESQVGNQTRTIVDLHKMIKTKSETIEKLTAEITDLQKTHAKSAEELTLRAEAVGKLDDHRVRLEHAVVKANEELAQKTEALQLAGAQRIKIEEALGKARYDLKMKNSELDDQKIRSSKLASEVGELQTTSQRITELQALLNKREQADEQVVNELRTLREQYAEAYKRQQELQVQLNEATSYRESMENEFGQHGTDVRLLKMKLKASEETIRKLRRERAGVLARLANYRTIAEPDATVISFTEALAIRERQGTRYDSEYGGRTSHHEKRGVIYTEAPETKDDLKRISGIAEVLEGRLNDYGIYTFKQIMDWEPAAIEEFSRLLAFRDRIERDDWRSQARFFYDEKSANKKAMA